MTQDALGALVEVSGAAVSQWERGETAPTLENFLALLGELKKLAEETDNLDLLMMTLAFKKMTPASAGDSRDQSARAVPLISQVTAGLWGLADDPYPIGMAEDFVSVDRNYSAGTFALRIQGDSMLEKFRSGDLVVIDPDVGPIPGDYVVAKIDHHNESTFKKVRFREAKSGPMVELKPLNDDFPTLTLDKSNPGRIIGVMVEHRSFRDR